MKRTFAFATAALLAGSASALSLRQVVAYDNFGGDDLNLTSFTGEESFSSSGDGFGEYNSGDSAPFAVIDASAGTFPSDSLGIVPDDAGGNYDAFFGIVDTNNGDTGGANVTATWTFDVTGAQDIEVFFDFAAMGDFESANDGWAIQIEIDGLTVAAFATSVDEDANKNYTLAGGGVFNLNDPMSLDGTELSNVYTTFSTGILGDGDTVTFSITGTNDGGSEALALDNIFVTAIPEPSSLALLGLGGLLIARRRRG